MCPVDHIIDQAVATIHLCLDLTPRAGLIECAGEVEIGCVRFATAS